jgi:hypothetical protein
MLIFERQVESMFHTIQLRHQTQQRAVKVPFYANKHTWILLRQADQGTRRWCGELSMGNLMANGNASVRVEYPETCVHSHRRPWDP